MVINGKTAGDVITVAAYTINTINSTRALLDVSASDVEANGTFSNSEDVNIVLVKNGSTGPTGPQGAQGTTGTKGQKGAGTTIANDTNNRVVTADGSGGLNGEANLTFNGSTLSVTGNINATSDIIAFHSSDQRLKDNIIPIDNPIEKVKQISGVEFDWNDKQDFHTGHDIGVIAQEIEEVLPDIVRLNDKGFKQVRYEKIIALLIEAIKEQQKELEELKNKFK